jgi:hypothetical protein
VREKYHKLEEKKVVHTGMFPRLTFAFLACIAVSTASTDTFSSELRNSLIHWIITNIDAATARRRPKAFATSSTGESNTDCRSGKDILCAVVLVSLSFVFDELRCGNTREIYTWMKRKSEKMPQIRHGHNEHAMHHMVLNVHNIFVFTEI